MGALHRDSNSRPELVRPIGANIHLYEPLSQRDPASQDPSLVILCTWLGGSSPRRINKYISGHHALFPSSSLLLIEARIAEITVLPFSVLRARLKPARDAITSILSSNSTVGELKPSILLHIFSHGGCNTAIQLAQSFKGDSDSTQSGFDFSRHLRNVIFDCCPGDSSFGRSYDAAVVSLPQSFPLNAVGKLLLYPSIGALSALQSSGIISSVDNLRKDLNAPELFGVDAKRLYLYSRADKMVRWEDVESHMKEAEAKCGIAAYGRLFSDSAHCAIVRGHEHEYWSTVGSFWTRGEVAGNKDATSCPKL